MRQIELGLFIKRILPLCFLVGLLTPSASGANANNPDDEAFRNATASEITVIKKVKIDLDFPCCASISPDCKKMAYVTSVNIPGSFSQKFTIRIFDFDQEKEVNSIPIEDGLVGLGIVAVIWSPDETRLCCECSTGNPFTATLSIIDIAKKKTVALPGVISVSPNSESIQSGHFKWLDENAITYVGGLNTFKLDLDTLKNIYPFAGYKDDDQFKKQYSQMFQSPLTHPHCYVHTSYDSGGFEDQLCLLIENNDHSYCSALVWGQDFENNFTVATDLRHFAIQEDSKTIELYYLGLREKRPIYFNLPMDLAFLADEIKSYRASNPQEHPEIFVNVYAPRINPLNNKIVGPEDSSFKGTLKILTWDSTNALGVIVFEKQTIQPEDIAADFRLCPNHGNGRYTDVVGLVTEINNPDSWAALIPAVIQQAPSVLGSPDQSITAKIEDNPVAVPATLQETLTKAKGGDAEAQYHLAKAYLSGQGVDTNYAEAVEWFQKGADQGNADCQNGLGFIYKNGLGMDKDYVEALKWFQKAAEQGNAKAQSNLGLAYETGQGVNKDYAEAIKWYRKAVEQGNADGQANLGMMYKNGWGVDKDYAEAQKWFQKAADQGNEFAKRALQQLNNSQ
jgi:Flp pilus assembly protein TadD